MDAIKIETRSATENLPISLFIKDFLFFIDIKQEHYPPSTSPAEPVTKNEDQVRMM